jgi:hypothetical protein
MLSLVLTRPNISTTKRIIRSEQDLAADYRWIIAGTPQTNIQDDPETAFNLA